VILAGRRVLLGVTGGIASYKACHLARRLAEAGTAVDVVLTAAAAEFVRPLTFEALTGRPVLTSLWTPGRALDHIALARDPDFKRYAGFEGRWSRELSQMQFSAGDETRFYAAGMAEAVLLDRLRPGWKASAFSDGTWLESLVAEALKGE